MNLSTHQVRNFKQFLTELTATMAQLPYVSSLFNTDDRFGVQAWVDQGELHVRAFQVPNGTVIRETDLKGVQYKEREGKRHSATATLYLLGNSQAVAVASYDFPTDHQIEYFMNRGFRLSEAGREALPSVVW